MTEYYQEWKKPEALEDFFHFFLIDVSINNISIFILNNLLDYINRIKNWFVEIEITTYFKIKLLMIG